MLGWQEYAVVNGDDLTPAAGAVRFQPHPDIPLDAYVSALGLTGWTAYVGVKFIGKVRPGDKVLISGAAGSTGLLACQIAKAAGATVIGIAGGREKCDLLVNELKLDGCIDYKATADLSRAMAEAYPAGIDVTAVSITKRQRIYPGPWPRLTRRELMCFLTMSADPCSMRHWKTWPLVVAW
jgi:NADPH-dependent curcumin reductase CurA